VARLLGITLKPFLPVLCLSGNSLKHDKKEKD